MLKVLVFFLPLLTFSSSFARDSKSTAIGKDALVCFNSEAAFAISDTGAPKAWIFEQPSLASDNVNAPQQQMGLELNSVKKILKPAKSADSSISNLETSNSPYVLISSWLRTESQYLSLRNPSLVRQKAPNAIANSIASEGPSRVRGLADAKILASRSLLIEKPWDWEPKIQAGCLEVNSPEVGVAAPRGTGLLACRDKDCETRRSWRLAGAGSSSALLTLVPRA